MLQYLVVLTPGRSVRASALAIRRGKSARQVSGQRDRAVFNDGRRAPATDDGEGADGDAAATGPEVCIGHLRNVPARPRGTIRRYRRYQILVNTPCVRRAV